MTMKTLMKMRTWRFSNMGAKEITAIVLVVFIVGAAVWLHVRKKNK